MPAEPYTGPGPDDPFGPPTNYVPAGYQHGGGGSYPNFPWDAVFPSYEGTPKPSDVNKTKNPAGPKLQCARLDEWRGLAYGTTRVCLKKLFAQENDTVSANFAIGGLDGPIEGWDAFWINGVDCSSTDGITFAAYTGTDPQSMDTWLDSTVYTGQTLAGTAWFRCYIQKTGFIGPDGWAELIPGGREDIEWGADLRGLKLYDPRTGLTVFNNNPALVIWDLLVRVGRIPTSMLSASSFSAAADACDAMVGSPSAKRFTFDGVFAQQTPLDSMIHAVRLCCNGELYMDQGQYKLFVDVENAGSPALALDDRTNFQVSSYEWVDDSEQPTRVIVEFPNAANGFLYDSVTVDNPDLASGAVELKEARYRVEGCTNQTRAGRIATFVLNQPTVALRINGETTFAGIVLTRGTKVSVTTTEGLSVQECLVSDANRKREGLWGLALRQYSASVYGDAALSGTTPPSTGPPPLSTPPSDDITVTDATGEEEVVAGTVNRVTTTNIFQVVTFTLPSSTNVPIRQIRIRGIRDAAALSKTWADLAGTELTIPLTGNRPPVDATHLRFVHPAVIKTIRTETRDQLGNVIDETEVIGPTRIFVKLEGLTGVLSTGVTIDVASGGATTTTGPYDYEGPLTIAPYGTAPGETGELRLRELAANGTNYAGIRAPDALAADLMWTLPETIGAAGRVLGRTGAGGALTWLAAGGLWEKFVEDADGSRTLFQAPASFSGEPLVVADGQVLCPTSFNPQAPDTAGYSRSGLNFTFARAPLYWVGLLYTPA